MKHVTLHTRRTFTLRPAIRLLCTAVLFAVFMIPQSTAAATQTVDVTAKQWSFSPSTITVTEGDTVVLNITSADVDHGFYIGEFGVDTQLSAGKTTTVTFVADAAGEYSFFCSVYCGSGHGGMTGTLVVVAASDETTEAEENEEASDEEDEEDSDGTAPAISSVTITETTSSTAVITWETDESGVGQVEYGVRPGTYIAATPLEEEATTSHAAYLSGLSAGTTYYYRVKTQDLAQNLGTSKEKTLTTEDEPGEEEEEEDEETSDEESADEDEDSEDESEEGEEVEEDSDDETTDEETSDEEGTDEDEDESEEGEEVEFALTSIVGESNSYDSDDLAELLSMTFEQNEQITLSGTAPSQTQVAIEVCCPETRYTAVSSLDGDWSFQHTLALDPGEHEIVVYERGNKENSETIEFTIREFSDTETESEPESETTSGGSINWVGVMVIIGFAILILAGILLLRRMRR